MNTKKPKKPDLPKPRNPFPELGPRWLKVEPARLATIGGLFFSMVTMVFYFVRQHMGISMDPMDMVLGIFRVFLVSYAGTGFFVWYLLRVAERQAGTAVTKDAPPTDASETATEDNWEEGDTPPEPPEEPL